MQYDFSGYIAAYDDMLLMDEKDLDGWKLKSVNPKGDSEDDDSTKDIKKELALAICRHVIEDFLGWTPEEARDHFGPRIAKMYRLNRVLCTRNKAKERIPSYGIFQFISLSKINYHYLLSMMYPNLLFDYGSYRAPFSYPKEAILMYKRRYDARYIAAHGGSVSDTRISKMLFYNLSMQDEVDTMAEFIRYFVNDLYATKVVASGNGRAYDVYRFFSDNTAISKLITAAELNTVFTPRALSCYDMICDYAEAVIPQDDLFYRKVFSYIYASTIKAE